MVTRLPAAVAAPRSSSRWTYFVPTARSRRLSPVWMDWRAAVEREIVEMPHGNAMPVATSASMFGVRGKGKSQG